MFVSGQLCDLQEGSGWQLIFYIYGKYGDKYLQIVMRGRIGEIEISAKDRMHGDSLDRTFFRLGSRSQTGIRAIVPLLLVRVGYIYTI